MQVRRVESTRCGVSRLLASCLPPALSNAPFPLFPSLFSLFSFFPCLDWAFNYPVGGDQGRAIWGSCPEGLDVLITHGPPLGVGDRTVRNVSAGCADLLKYV